MNALRIVLVCFACVTTSIAEMAVVDVEPGRDVTVHIATGIKITENLDGEYGGCSYSVQDVLQGVFNTNTIVVLFHASTYQGNLPSPALLLLWRDGGQFYRPIGEDLARGVLEYDDRRQALLQQGDIDQVIAESLFPASLDKARALDLAKEAIVENDIDLGEIPELRISRDPWGWEISGRRVILGSTYDATTTLSIRVSDAEDIVRFHQSRYRLMKRDDGDLIAQ